MIRFEAFKKLGVAVAAMSDKSDGDCGLGGNNQSEGAHVLSRKHFCESCGSNYENIVSAKQVHGNKVACVGEEDRGKDRQWKTALDDTDGLVTNIAGITLAITIADCVPVFIYDPVQKCGGVIHAGREGTFKKISAKAIEVLTGEYASDPANIHAVIGPSAGPCCYEVSQELADAFSKAGLPTKGRNLDLWAANAQQLAAAGLPQSSITISRHCTICTDDFHSHRADPKAGRNIALFML